MNWAAKMAVGLDTGVPWVMCKDENAPDPVVYNDALFTSASFHFHLLLTLSMKDLNFVIFERLQQINTCNGFYCDSFSPNKPYKPTMWTEAWSGW